MEEDRVKNVENVRRRDVASLVEEQSDGRGRVGERLAEGNGGVRCGRVEVVWEEVEGGQIGGGGGEIGLRKRRLRVRSRGRVVDGGWGAREGGRGADGDGDLFESRLDGSFAEWSVVMEGKWGLPRGNGAGDRRRELDVDRKSVV